ncbi:uncharacterized protein LOC109838571 [Asparagus officinalis]|uniref:uncharacterized protein LOC109838571 n=1 Tax=Asparagus officinalis TaxID=4686 RepID=UPI00098E1BF0|nr:uncharacterized protein LOC109838571 [Asparagus officinalis]
MEQPEYRAGMDGVLTCIEVEEKYIPEIIEEFLDILPDELSSLPPDRDIEFIINLILRVAPISKPPYWMLIADFEELCKQVLEKFIKDFTKIAEPLTRLTRKEVKFVWTQDCQAAFEGLKKKLTTSPVLIILDESGGFIVHTDASGLGLACVLM